MQITKIGNLNIVFAALLCTLSGCQNNLIENSWKMERFHNYLFKIPINCKLYSYSHSTEHAVISNGRVIDGIVTGGDINIDLFEGYGYPTIYDADATNIKIKSIGSVKEKILTYNSGLNKGLILICIWDTLKSAKFLSSHLAYKEFVLSEKNASAIQKKMIIEIFNSIKENALIPQARGPSEVL